MSMVDLFPKRSKFYLNVERFGPIVISLICVGAIYHLSHSIVLKFEADGGWQAANLYSAIFTWSAIQTGFAFGVYGFVAGKADGFIAEVRDTLAMRRFMGYVKRANIGGFLLTICSLPLAVATPPVTAPDSWMFFFIVFWFGLFVWTFLAFLRIAYSFGHLSSVKDQPSFHGA